MTADPYQYETDALNAAMDKHMRLAAEADRIFRDAYQAAAKRGATFREASEEAYAVSEEALCAANAAKVEYDNLIVAIRDTRNHPSVRR